MLPLFGEGTVATGVGEGCPERREDVQVWSVSIMSILMQSHSGFGLQRPSAGLGKPNA